MSQVSTDVAAVVIVVVIAVDTGEGLAVTARTGDGGGEFSMACSTV